MGSQRVLLGLPWLLEVLFISGVFRGVGPRIQGLFAQNSVGIFPDGSMSKTSKRGCFQGPKDPRSRYPGLGL